MKHARSVVPFAWELASVKMLMVGVRLFIKLEILVVASIAAPSRSNFFWVGFCAILDFEPVAHLADGCTYQIIKSSLVVNM